MFAHSLLALRAVPLLRVALVVAVVSACAPGPTPTPIPRPVPAAPPPVAVAPAPVVTRYTIPGVVTDTHYDIEARTEIDRDSAGRHDKQQLTSRASMLVRERRQANGALSASGRISSYRVTSGLTSTPVVLDSLRFDAVLDSQALRVVSQPPLANECDRPESGALSLIRDVFVRIPVSVAVGDSWRDSTVQLVCRASLPMVVRSTAEYVVLDSARADNSVVLSIRRTTTTTLAGKSASPWRAIDITGTGTATLTFRVAVLSGAVRKLDGSSSLTLTVTDRTSPTALRTQQVTQRVTLSAQAIGN